MSRRLPWVTEPGYRRGKTMRAARRIFVLAGILAMAVFAPITWSQAGAQSAPPDGGDALPEITFIKIMCADFGAIPAQLRVTRQRPPARPEGTTLGPQRIAQTVSAEEHAPDGCEQVDGWPFVLGSDADLVENPIGGGRRVDPSLPAASHRTQVTLSRSQADLLDGRNLRASEVQQDGFAFGTIRVRHRQHQRRQPRVHRQRRSADLRGVQRRGPGDHHQDRRGLRPAGARGRLSVPGHVR